MRVRIIQPKSKFEDELGPFGVNSKFQESEIILCLRLIIILNYSTNNYPIE